VLTADLQALSIELPQQLIRSACLPDGSPNSGGERRNADVLADFLIGAELDVARFTPCGDRTAIVARIDGSDPGAPACAPICGWGASRIVSAERPPTHGTG
jgi:hypothetical protein